MAEKANKLVDNGVTVVTREFKNWRKRNDDKWTTPFVETKYLENIYIITEKIQTVSFEELRRESKIMRIGGTPTESKHCCRTCRRRETPQLEN